MQVDEIICRIFYNDGNNSIQRHIIAIIDKRKLFSPEINFIEIKNYGNKELCKENIRKMVIYENFNRVILNNDSLKTSSSIKMEG